MSGRIGSALFVAMLGACGGTVVLPGDATQPTSTTDDAPDAATTTQLPPSVQDAGVVSTSDAATTPGAGGNNACDDLVPALPATSGTVLHVAVDGSDTNDGDSTHPFATLARALKGVQPGTRILIGSGTYLITNEYKALTGNDAHGPALYASINGTAAEPIVVTAEAGAQPIFDAVNTTNLAYEQQAAFGFQNSSHVILDSVEIVGQPYPTLNSDGSYSGPLYAGAGFAFEASTFCTLSRCKIHQIPESAITFSGTDLVFAGNEIYDVVEINKNGGYQKFQDSWPSAVAGWYQTDSKGAYLDWNRRISYLGNTVHDSWGEGLNGLFTDTVDMIGNTVYNCWSTYLYLDHARNVRILRNLVQGGGVSIDDENYGSAVPFMPQDNILIANNYFGHSAASGFRTSLALFRFDVAGQTSSPQNTWSHLHVIDNIIDLSEGIWFDSVKGSTKPVDGLLAGNIFLNATENISLLDDSVWTVRNNDFVGKPSWNGYTPAVVSGSMSVTPSFVGPADGTSFAGFAVTNAAALTIPTESGVTTDALCATRNATRTTAGVIGP